MRHIKRVITIFLIFFIMAAPLVPSLRCSYFVFADSDIEWENINSNEELRDAWLYYLKSRNILIEGSILDVSNEWTTHVMVGLANFLGLNVGQIINDHIKKSGNTYLYDSDAIDFMDGITQGLLQDYNLEVGDIDVDEVVYSGMYFIDDDGNKCLCTVYSGTGGSDLPASLIQFGTSYKGIYGRNFFHGYGDFNNVNHTYTLTKNGNTYTWTWQHRLTGDLEYWRTNISNDSSPIIFWYRGYGLNKPTYDGYQTILYDSSKGKYYIGVICKTWSNSGVFTNYYIRSIQEIVISSDAPTPATVNIVSTEINNNDYSNNTYTTINNNGDVNNYDGDEEPPINPPSDEPTNPSDWGVDLPDINIDWLLTGKEDKFPFNIPFNIILTLSLLNAEPEAPHFEGTVDLGVYQWNYDIDFEQFDSVAEVCRNFEFIAFLIGLMLLTKRLIWG